MAFGTMEFTIAHAMARTRRMLMARINHPLSSERSWTRTPPLDRLKTLTSGFRLNSGRSASSNRRQGMHGAGPRLGRTWPP